MFWVTVTVSVLVSLAVCAVYVHLWRRRIRRDMETDTIAAKLRREVEEMVRDLNGTTERNIALIENRIASLNELIDKAGKTTGVLRRESEKHDIASQVYTSLERSRPLTPSLNLVVDDEAEKKKQPENGNPSPSGAEAEEIGPAATPGAGGSGRRSEVVDFQSLPVRDKVLVLHRNGETVDAIASRFGLSRGEVELIISIHQRRGD